MRVNVRLFLDCADCGMVMAYDENDTQVVRCVVSTCKAVGIRFRIKRLFPDPLGVEIVPVEEKT